MNNIKNFPYVKLSSMSRRHEDMGVDLIFKIAAIGILVAILNALLDQTGRKEVAVMTTIVGLVIILLMVVKEIVNLFDTVKTLFQF